jgi:hypothetical protein
VTETGAKFGKAANLSAEWGPPHLAWFASASVRRIEEIGQASESHHLVKDSMILGCPLCPNSRSTTQTRSFCTLTVRFQVFEQIGPTTAAKALSRRSAQSSMPGTPLLPAALDE